MQTLLPLAAKIQFQQAVNTVNAFMVPGMPVPAQQLEQFLKSVPRVALCQPTKILRQWLPEPLDEVESPLNESYAGFFVPVDSAEQSPLLWERVRVRASPFCNTCN
jgi:hypothetical protein